MAAILNFLNKILGFYYVFNVFEILSVNRKYLDSVNLKWRVQYGKLCTIFN